MRKPVFIAATLAMAIAVMGAGYAAWSENITINNNVQTGNMRVEFVKTIIPPDTVFHPWITSFDNVGSLPAKVDATISHGAKVTEVSISNLYPGATALFETRIENLGTIPAVAEGAQVIFPNATAQTEILKDNIICRGQVMHWRPTENGTVMIEARGIPVDTGVTLENLEPTLTKMVEGMELLPGDFLTFDIDKDYASKLKALPDFASYDPNGQNCLILTLPSSAGNDTKSLLNTQFQIKFNFKQFNQ